MTISRGQTPRQLYGLGSFVKSITKPIKKAVNVVKDVAKSDLGKAALLGASVYGLGGGTFFGRGLPGIAAKGSFGLSNIAPNIMNYLVGTQGPPGTVTKGLLGSGGKFSKLGLGTAILGTSALGGALTPEAQADVEALRQSDDTEALEGYLRRYYRNLNPDADQIEVENFVRANKANGGSMQDSKESKMSERVKELMDEGYEFGEAVKAAMKEGYAQGGRIGYNKGTNNPFLKMIDKVAPKEDPLQKLADKISPLFIDKDGDYRKGLQKAKFALSKFIAGKGTDLDTGAEWYSKLDDNTQKEIIMEKIKYRSRGQLGGTPLYDEKFAGRYGIGGNYAQGGRIEENVDQASGIMGLPQRTNAAGVKELDLRKSGGFIPPVGVKEKADDIPAMLSNNEFVFTADAVRGMGDGDVNKGAQRMYNMMKKLEKEGRVA